MCEEGRTGPNPGPLRPVPSGRQQIKSKSSHPADMCGWMGHRQGNLPQRVCEPPCGECAVLGQILSKRDCEILSKRDCAAEARPADETAEAEQGQRSVFASGFSPRSKNRAPQPKQGGRFSVLRRRQKRVPPGHTETAPCLRLHGAVHLRYSVWYEEESCVTGGGCGPAVPCDYRIPEIYTQTVLIL